MMRKSSFWIVALLIIALAAFPAITKASPTSISMTPLRNGYDPGFSFTIHIDVDGVTNLNLWGVTLRYDPQLLSVTSVVEGPFLKTVGETEFGYTQGPDYVSMYGLLTEAVGASGDGILASVTFGVQYTGNCTMDLKDSTLGDINGNPIAHTATDGSFYTLLPRADFEYRPRSGDPDYPSSVGQTVTFNASASYAPEGGEIVGYNWDFGDGETATGKIVTHAYKNSGVYMINLTVRAMPPPFSGDLDGSGKVDWKDLLILARAYGSDPTKPNWDPRADIDGNGKVDWKDLLTLARNYGRVRAETRDSVTQMIYVQP